MQIGKIIRKYRKEKNMTQEEMANRLGVTASAVNKWEKGVSMPDIMILAPIARLFGISIDALLTFQEELTDQEVNALIEEANEKLKKGRYQEVFYWGKSQMEKYPNCEHLLLWMATTLDAKRLIGEVENRDIYDDFFRNIYLRLLQISEEYVKTTAADLLYGFCMRKEKYQEAEKYLEYFSIQNPERKRKKAFLYDRSGRIEEAYKLYEELLFSEYQIINMIFNSMFSMSVRENNLEKAEFFVEKSKNLIKTFGMGEYYEYSMQLEFARMKKDQEMTLNCAKHILSHLDTISSFSKSRLYEHMEFKEVSSEFKKQLEEKLRKNFLEGEEFYYMRDNKNWKKLLE